MPAADYTGLDTFTYRASDGQATSEPATVSLYVASNTVITVFYQQWKKYLILEVLEREILVRLANP